MHFVCAHVQLASGLKECALSWLYLLDLPLEVGCELLGNGPGGPSSPSLARELHDKSRNINGRQEARNPIRPMDR